MKRKKKPGEKKMGHRKKRFINSVVFFEGQKYNLPRVCGFPRIYCDGNECPVGTNDSESGLRMLEKFLRLFHWFILL